ncbi:MAG: exodeoxyribonuclease VII small subunit [Raoultibacter sp.]
MPSEERSEECEEEQAFEEGSESSAPSESFAAVKARLEEIVVAVNDESTSLDDALTLYEEAVKLSMQASNELEEQRA